MSGKPIDIYNLTHSDDAQCGGIACTHPSQEGYYLPMWDICQDLDECEYGCANLTKSTKFDNPDLRKALADEIQKRCDSIDGRHSFSLAFDYSRIDELQEGWWPLIINGRLYDIDFDNQPCIYHRGNCD